MKIRLVLLAYSIIFITTHSNAEATKLEEIKIFEETNKIDFEILTNIRKYKTFEFLKDLN